MWKEFEGRNRRRRCCNYIIVAKIKKNKSLL